MSTRYKILDAGAMHFVTFSVVDWIDVFIREAYCNILLDSFRYCQQHKGLVVHAWCIMSSHVHLIISVSDPARYSLSEILRDMKKFTAREILKDIAHNVQESRQGWLLRYFRWAGKGELNQFWHHDNHPVEISSNHFLDQKMDYIHNNPVVAGLVDEPWQYRYSSARDYAGIQGLLKLDMV